MESAQNRSPHRLTWPDQTLPRKLSPMGLNEQPGRGRGHRNTAKRARHGGTRDVFTISNPATLAKSYWKVVHRQFGDDDSLREYHILRTLRQIPSKLIDHPRVSEPDSSGKVFWIKSPRLRWVPLLLRVKDWALDHDSLLEMQGALQDYIRLLYSKGVAYQVKPEYMCPVRMESGRWKLYLGGWMEAEFDPNKTRVQSAEWKTREATQGDEIKRIFAEARAAVTGRCH